MTRYLIILIMLLATAAAIQAQVTISGNLTATGGQNIVVVYSLDGYQYVDGNKYTTIDSAIAGCPSGGCEVILPPGNTPCPTTAITTPVTIQGAGMGGLLSNLTSFQSQSTLTNNTTGSACITIGLPASNFLSGVILRDFAISGNKNVSGATAGDDIVIAGGSSSTSIRDVLIQNVLAYNAFGNGLSMKENSYLIKVRDSQFMRNGGNGIGISNTGTGIPSQISLENVTSDLNTGDALNMNGSNVADVTAYRSTFADSANGVNVVHGSPNGSPNATFNCFGCNFEGNANAGVSLNDGYGHTIIASHFPADSTQQFGVNLAPPASANFILNQMLLLGNNFGASKNKDINISSNAHVCTIFPQAGSQPLGYTYNDASGNCVVMDSFAAGLAIYPLRIKNVLYSNGSPTLSPASSFNTGTMDATPNGTMTFIVTVGSGAANSTGTISFPAPAAVHGWNCHADNQSRAALISQTASTTTSCTLTNYGTTFAATNWTNGDVLIVFAEAR